MSWGVIARIGFLTLETADLDATLATACGMLGLRETKRLGQTAYLAADAVHHEIIYRAGPRNAVSHISLEARDPDAIEQIRRRVVEAGLRIVSEAPLEEGVGQALSFVGPDGFVFEVFVGLATLAAGPTMGGPDRYGHINLHPTNAMKMRDFLIDVLDFRVSDAIGSTGFFLRCNADHHGIALLEGRGALHHHAWETQSIADLGKLADRLDGAGRQLLWGPVRHGAGHNIAAYFEEPTGCVVELYCDLEQIYDDRRPPVQWSPNDLRWFNRWSDYRPADFRRFGVPPASMPM